MATPQRRNYYCPHFTDVATKVQRRSFEVSQWVSSGVKEEEVMGRSELLLYLTDLLGKLHITEFAHVKYTVQHWLMYVVVYLPHSIYGAIPSPKGALKALCIRLPCP